MTEVVSLVSRKREACVAAFVSYVQDASVRPVFGDPTIDFWSDWKLRLGDRARPRHTIQFQFSKLHADLGHYMRAYITRLQSANRVKPHAASQYVRTAVFLSAAMAEQECSSVLDVTPRVLSRAQELIEGRGFQTDTVSDQCARLERISKELVYRGISLREFNWTHPYGPKKPPDVFSQEARAKERSLLPERRALQALADLRSVLEEQYRAGSVRARFDLIIYWMVVVAFATGLRANEVISNHRNFVIRREVLNSSGIVEHVYLYRRKTSKGGPSDARPLSPIAAELCRRAQKYLHVLTRRSRAALANYLAIGDTAPEWEGIRDRSLTPADVEARLGLRSRQSRRKLMEDMSHDGAVFIDDLRCYLNAVQERFLEGVSREKASEYYRPVFTEWVGVRGRRLGQRVVRFIDYADIRNFIAGNGREVDSAFVRYLGTHYRLAMHQFRRLMDTSVREGGVSENELAVLQGRANPAQNAVYDYRTPDERADDVRNAIRNGESYGWVASAYWSMPADERDDFLDSMVQVAYRTPVGHCLTNILETGCPFHLQCLSGCGDFLHVKGDTLALEGLEKHRKWASETLVGLREAEAADSSLSDGAQNHRSHINTQLRTIERVLEIEANSEMPEGASVRVFPNNPSFSEDPNEW